MAIITLVRHGQASFGADDYDCLSSKGKKQAKLLGNRFKQQRETITQIFIGDMLRHKQTAQHCLKSAGITLPMQCLAGLNEFDHQQVIERYEPRYADKNEILIDLLKSGNPNDFFTIMFKGALERWMNSHFDSDYDEPWQAFKTRTQAAFQQIIESCGDHDNVLVFTSGGVISNIVSQLLNLENEQTLRINWALANAGITRVRKQYGEALLLTLNDFSHFNHPYDQLVTWK